MKKEEFYKAIDSFEPDADMEMRIREAVMSYRTRKRLWRIASCIIVALLISSITIASAYQVSPQFREAVQAILKLVPTEVLPPPEDEPEVTGPFVIEQKDIDNISVHYLKFPGPFDNGFGVVIRSVGEDGAEFYRVAGNELEKLDYSSISTEIIFQDRVYPLQFNYCIFQGRVSLHMPHFCEGTDVNAIVSPLPGRTDTVMLTLSQGRQREYSEYKMLLNLTTWETTDFLENCDLTGIEKITEIYVSEDISRAIIRGRDDSEEYYYLCELDTGTVTPMEEILQRKVDFSGFLNNNTIYYLSYIYETRFSYWSYDLDTGKSTLIFEDERFYSLGERGVDFLYGQYALYINYSGGTTLVNLVTGEKTEIGNFQFTKDTSALLNPAGTRILFTKHDFKNEDLGITEIGVHNIQTGEISILTRQGYENRAEVSLGWFDNERVEVRAMNESGEYYLYLYEFHE